MNKITLEYLHSLVEKETYHRFEGTTVTVCLLTLKNGFNVVGESACADPANFNSKDGEVFAKVNASNKLWSLEGYLLKKKISDNTHQ